MNIHKLRQRTMAALAHLRSINVQEERDVHTYIDYLEVELKKAHDENERYVGLEDKWAERTADLLEKVRQLQARIDLRDNREDIALLKKIINSSADRSA